MGNVCMFPPQECSTFPHPSHCTAALHLSHCNDHYETHWRAAYNTLYLSSVWTWLMLYSQLKSTVTEGITVVQNKLHNAPQAVRGLMSWFETVLIRSSAVGFIDNQTIARQPQDMVIVDWSCLRGNMAGIALQECCFEFPWCFVLEAIGLSLWENETSKEHQSVYNWSKSGTTSLYQLSSTEKQFSF